MRYRRHEILGKNGSYEILQLLYAQAVSEIELIRLLTTDTLSSEELKSRVNELKDIWFIEQPPKSVQLRITDDGIEAFLLIRVINGETFNTVINQLSQVRYITFSLLTEDITGCFIDVLRSFQNLKEIYLCSPWIRLHDRHLADLEIVLSKGKVVVRAITKFPDVEFRTPKWRDQIATTLEWMKKQGAEIVGHPALHTKLYIAIGRDSQVAIFGSENLTGAKNLELGIKVSDETIVGKLLLYWLEIYNQCIVM